MGRHYPIAYCSDVRRVGFLTEDVCCGSCHSDEDEGYSDLEHWGALPWLDGYLAICCAVANTLDAKGLVPAVFTEFRFRRWLKEKRGDVVS